MNPSENPQQPLFRFLQMSDLHVTADPARAPFVRAVERARWLTSELAAGSLAGIDLVLCIGDAINGGTPDNAREDYEAFNALTGEMSQPLLAVPGNHETNAREGDPEYSALFRQAFGVAAHEPRPQARGPAVPDARQLRLQHLRPGGVRPPRALAARHPRGASRRSQDPLLPRAAGADAGPRAAGPVAEKSSPG